MIYEISHMISSLLFLTQLTHIDGKMNTHRFCLFLSRVLLQLCNFLHTKSLIGARVSRNLLLVGNLFAMK